jgi:hypothetical protein
MSFWFCFQFVLFTKKIAPEGAIFVGALSRYKRLTICCLTLDYVNDIYLKRLA